jgi:tetratricopeptide (TPR) repeat protein
LEEADDFIPRGAAIPAEARIERLVATHRTTVLKSSAAGVTPLQAVQQYYTHAQEQLAAAVRPSPEGSRALSALGKLYLEMDREPGRLATDAKTKGLACQQAALLVDPNNALAANELGVQLAREARFEEAREWLRHSVRVKPSAETWNNLAAVHTSLGEAQLADAARTQSVSLARRQGGAVAGSPVVQVKQLSPSEFAAVGQGGMRTAVAPVPAGTQQAAAKPKSSSAWDWLPWR